MKPYSILIVDDEVNNLNALNRTFRNEYDVFLATDEKDAFAIMEKEDIALVLTENRMNSMNSIEFLKRVSQKYPDTVCVILAAYTNEKTVLDAISMGHIHSYITKPWEPEEAKVVIRAGLEAYETTRSRNARETSREQWDSDLEAQKARTKMLGQILMDYGVISEDQLASALDLQKHGEPYEGKKLGEILVDLGYVNEEGILSCYALQLGMPYILLSEFSVQPEITELLPSELASKYALVPIDLLGRVLSVAVSEPLSNGARSEIEKKTGYKVMTVCALREHIEIALKQYYPDGHRDLTGREMA